MQNLEISASALDLLCPRSHSHHIHSVKETVYFNTTWPLETSCCTAQNSFFRRPTLFLQMFARLGWDAGKQELCLCKLKGECPYAFQIFFGVEELVARNVWRSPPITFSVCWKLGIWTQTMFLFMFVWHCLVTVGSPFNSTRTLSVRWRLYFVNNGFGQRDVGNVFCW